MTSNTFNIGFPGHLWEWNNPFVQQNDNPFLQRVLKIIRENLSDENFFLNDLCRAVHLERTQVYRKVKASTGKGPSELIREARLLKARSLLKETNLNIAEIAFRTGFKESSHFTKSYRMFFGETPTADRKAVA